MKIRMLAGLLSIIGGFAIVAIWIFTFFQVQLVDDVGLKNIIDHILSMLRGGDTLEFFSYSVLCVLGCFLSGGLFISGKFPKFGIVVVLANSVAVSIMFAWFIAALIASPLLLTNWVLKNA